MTAPAVPIAPAAPAAPAASVTLDSVSLGYAGDRVVTDLDLTVRAGEILVVLGHSGCGKSTLLRAISGLVPPIDGTLRAGGRPIEGPGADRALVFQEDALLPWRSARRNVELALAVQGVPRAERRRRAAEWLDRVGLSRFADRLPGQLSGGMRQRVQLARALAARPAVICMDEPFGALDAQTRASMQRLLVEAWQASGCTVVFVTHDVDEALALGDRVVVLGQRGIVSEHVVEHPRDPSDPPGPDVRAEILAHLATTHSLAPVPERTPA
jgi:NitT/TauT family transport system ATP-binding protein